MFESTIKYSGELSAIVTRADGSVEDWGIVSGARPVNIGLTKPMCWYEKLWHVVKREGKIPATMGLFAFIAWLLNDGNSAAVMAIVSTAGVNYMATDFASGGASPRISAFNFHAFG